MTSLKLTPLKLYIYFSAYLERTFRIQRDDLDLSIFRVFFQ